MAVLSLPISERLGCLLDFLSCIGKMYHWAYTPDGELLETNCPDKVLNNFLHTGGYFEVILKHFHESHMPILLSNRYSLIWCAAFEHEGGRISKIHVLGPITTTDMAHGGIALIVQSSKITPHWRPKLTKILQRIPVVSFQDFLRYTLMLHYCVTGEKITNADIVFSEPVGPKPEGDSAPQKDRMNTYIMEKALMRMITEGDLNYKDVLHAAAGASRGVHLDNMNSLEQVKVTQVVFISISTRAAIQGGLSPEIAYSRGDAYIQEVLNCTSVAEAVNIGHSMYDDFVHLVHKSRVNPNYSPQIQSVCDYIDVHVEDKLSLSDIASHVGYADYYLSRKFKQETGSSINDYIKTAKVERAKTLLLGTSMGIQEISERLNFGSRGFFAETFKEIAGIPPAAYRQQNLKS